MEYVRIAKIGFFDFDASEPYISPPPPFFRHANPSQVAQTPHTILLSWITPLHETVKPPRILYHPLRT